MTGSERSCSSACRRRAASKRRREKAINCRWWTLDPRTGADEWAACAACHGIGDAERDEYAEALHRERQRANRCPFIPETEWLEGMRESAGPNGEFAWADEDACPGAYARTPAALEASEARKWAERGELGLRYPRGLPEVVAAAVDFSDHVKDEWTAEGHRLRNPKPKHED